MSPTCLTCGGLGPFPLGRPRKDGSRWPMAHCEACWAGGRVRGDRRAARSRARRSYRRRAVSGVRVVLGPCPCRDCGAVVVFMGRRWVNQDDGHRHWCPSGLAA